MIGGLKEEHQTENNVLQVENFIAAALQQVMQMTVMHCFHLYSCGCELNMKADSHSDTNDDYAFHED